MKLRTRRPVLIVVLFTGLAAVVAFFALHAAAPGGHHAPQYGLAHFDVYADGDTLHLLAGYRSEGKPGVALWYRRSTDAGASWSAPVRVNAPEQGLFAPHPGENPQIAAHGDHVLAMWNSVDASGTPQALVTRVSDDGGKTFRDGANPASDGADDYHALAELGADAAGFHAVWLHGAKRGEAGSKQGLHYASSTDGVHWQAEQSVDAATCECCWNRIAAEAGNVSVLYRAGGPRDMKLAVRDGAAWHTSVVGKFDWDYHGCPHAGGALAARGKALHALVWTGKEGRQGLYYLRSDDGGAAWNDPQRLGGAEAMDSDLAIAADGSLDAVWDAEGAILHAQSHDGGKTWSAPAALSQGGERNRHPRTLATAQGGLSVWVEGPREASRLRSSRGDIAPPG